MDNGVCLKNMDTFFQIANLALDFGIVEYVQNEDNTKLAESLLMSRDLATWEKYQMDRSPWRETGPNTLSQSILQKAQQLRLDSGIVDKPEVSQIEQESDIFLLILNRMKYIRNFLQLIGDPVTLCIEFMIELIDLGPECSKSGKARDTEFQVHH